MFIGFGGKGTIEASSLSEVVALGWGDGVWTEGVHLEAWLVREGDGGFAGVVVFVAAESTVGAASAAPDSQLRVVVERARAAEVRVAELAADVERKRLRVAELELECKEVRAVGEATLARARTAESLHEAALASVEAWRVRFGDVSSEMSRWRAEAMAAREAAAAANQAVAEAQAEIVRLSSPPVGGDL